jgi:DNA invertase Pin-like site-specific DNA recombinase
MKSVFAYIRVSTVKQGEKGSSLTEQRLAIEAYAKRHDLTIIEWFEEQETAAKHGRVVFTRMLKLLVNGRASGVIIHKIDRSARNLRDWADLGNLIDKGIQLHFAHESLDLQTRGGRLAADIQAVVAADYIRNLRDEVKKGFYGRLRQGIYPLPAPIGYRDQGRGLPKLPDPITAPLVQRAFRLYATGQCNLRTLGVDLFKSGLRNRRGGRVTRTGLSTLLNSEFYIGIMHIRKTGERFTGIHEPLIKKSEFDRVQMILSGRTKNVGLKHDFMYRKFLKCQQCAYSLVAERQKGIVYYRCHTSTCPRTCIREHDITEQIQRALLRITMTEAEITSLEAEFDILEGERADQRNQLRRSLELQLANVSDRLQRVADAIIDQTMDREVLDEKNRLLLHERASLREEIGKLNNGYDPDRFRQQKFLELLRGLTLAPEFVSDEERRNTMKEATSNLSANQKDVVFDWRSPFDLVSMRSPFEYGAPRRIRTSSICSYQESNLPVTSTHQGSNPTRGRKPCYRPRKPVPSLIASPYQQYVNPLVWIKSPYANEL